MLTPATWTGYYDLPSGHLEADETLQAATSREIMEEVGVKVAHIDLSLFHIVQNAADTPYINFMFRTTRWSGEPKIYEPEKCDDIGFFSLNRLPRITPIVRELLAILNRPEITFTYFTPESFKALLE